MSRCDDVTICVKNDRRRLGWDSGVMTGWTWHAVWVPHWQSVSSLNDGCIQLQIMIFMIECFENFEFSILKEYSTGFIVLHHEVRTLMTKSPLYESNFFLKKMPHICHDTTGPHLPCLINSLFIETQQTPNSYVRDLKSNVPLWLK